MSTFTFTLQDLTWHQHTVALADLPPDWMNNWLGAYETSRFHTAAIVVNGYGSNGGTQELRLVDLETGSVLQGRSLAYNEFLLPTQNADSTYHIGSVANGILTIRSYAYGLDVTSAQLNTPLNTTNFVLPAGLNLEATNMQLSVQQYIPATAESAAYLITNGWDAYTSTYGTSLFNLTKSTKIALPTQNFEWAGNAFIYGSELWLETSAGQYDTSTWWQKHWMLDSAQNQWVPESDKYFWNLRDAVVAPESVVRIGSAAVDLLPLVGGEGTIIYMGNSPTADLGNGTVLIRVEVMPPDNPIGHEHWLVLDATGTVLTHKAFDTNTGIALRSMLSPNDGFIYFQQLNATLGMNADTGLPTVAQNSEAALSLYKIAISDITTSLQNASDNTPLDSLSLDPHAILINTFSQAAINNQKSVPSGHVVLLSGFISSSFFENGSTSVVFSEVFNPETDSSDGRYINTLNNNNVISHTAVLAGEIGDITADPIHGVFLSVHNATEQEITTHHFNIDSGKLIQIPVWMYEQIQNYGGVPSGTLFTPGTAEADVLGDTTTTAVQWLVAAEGNDTLQGGSGNDVLRGGSGNDSLDGGLGADNMAGGSGNDMYKVNHANDKVFETFADGTDTGGIDLVQSSVHFALGNFVEKLTLIGSAAINGTGNELANTLTGNVAANRLDGGAGNDTLNGGGGNDTLNGGSGADIMLGGSGNDTYYVYDLGDKAIETTTLTSTINAGGVDTVVSTISYALGIFIENLTLSGVATINGTGNNLANKLVGNSANNILTGGAGNDTLTGGKGSDKLIGGTGNDVFDFNALNELGLGAGKRDVIADFSVGDKIDLSTIDANPTVAGNQAFVFVSSFTTNSPGQVRFQNGMVYLNTDNDVGAEYEIALTGVTTLTATDFVL